MGTRTLIGVIGHVDHGKTALVRALTGQDTDRLPEEKARGISIALGFAHLPNIDLIDMPGHERFVRTMISGATGIDAVLLVVAANEGVKPQTLEHVNIASLLGLRRAVVAVSKADLVAPEEGMCVAEDARRLLVQSGLEPLPPVMTSALQQAGMNELRQALQSVAEDQPPRAANSSVFLPLDRAFSIAGHGPVVTGTLRGATVSVGDTLELLPSRRSVRVRAIQVHGAPVGTAMPGQRVALNLRDIEIAELARGMAVAAPDTLQLSDWLTMSIRAVEGAPALTNGMRLRALLGTAEFDVRLRLLDRDVLEAGQSGFAQLHLESGQIAIPTREHVVLRLLSPQQTVAGGKLLETGARRNRRKCLQALQRLGQLETLPPPEIVAAEVQRAGLAGTSLQQLSRISALAIPRVVELLRGQPVCVTRAGAVVWQPCMDDLLSRIPALLTGRSDGLSHAQLLSVSKGTGVPVLEAALVYLRARGLIIERNGQLLLPRPDADLIQLSAEAERGRRIAETLRRGGLTPPSPGTVVTDPQAKRAVDRLLRTGAIVRAVDRAKGREILFHQDAINEAQRRLAPLLERPGGLLVTEVGAALGISRKYSMPLLAHLDAIRFTVRIADRRVGGER